MIFSKKSMTIDTTTPSMGELKRSFLSLGFSFQILHVGMMPFIRPDYWRDRFGGRSLLIWV